MKVYYIIICIGAYNIVYTYILSVHLYFTIHLEQSSILYRV